MTTKTNDTSRRTGGFSQWQCFAIYLPLISLVICNIILMENKSRPLFHGLLFFTGWLTYTFLEHIDHRTCFIWRDKLFNTDVPDKFKISERVLQFHFGEDGH